MLDKFLPPTDNLYKFIAISGLLFIVASFIPHYLTFRLTEQRLEYIEVDDKFQVEIDQLKKVQDTETKKTNELKSSMEKLLEEHNRSPEAKINREEVEKLSQARKELEKEDVAFLEKFNAIRVKDAELDASERFIKFYELEIAWLESLAKQVFIAGMFFVVIGFYFWYKKMQKPNDLILMNQAQENLHTKSKRVKRVRPM